MRSSANKDRRKNAASEQSSEAVHELTLPLTEAPEPLITKPERPRRPPAEPVSKQPRPPAPPVEVLEPSQEADFGTALRRARELKGQTIHELANITRISARWIAALEQEKFDQLPATVFVTGYVRNLARALGIDPDDLQNRYRAQRETQEAANLTGTGGSDRFESAMRQRIFLAFTVLAVLVGVVALLVFVFQRRQS